MPQIPATAAATQALADLTAAHGPLLFHLTGGCCDAGTPLCLPQSELRIGARDILLGHIGETPLYQMPSTANTCPTPRAMTLDIAPGNPVGFSLDIGNGTRFVLR
jgi:uncharacterized protein (DUF779 family)